ncbi:hypothetical protein [uncultured Oxalicibacterium sp.]|uniref:hypothetical protein n=1 Tax=uncultured Oxalicibacterium sp. TaxID=1168540 RepID=UPI0025E933A3|nr:hypothetical protein [uncultured Oxalicibacterium sp.]
MSAKRKFVIALNVLALVIFFTDLTATRLLASEQSSPKERLILLPALQKQDTSAVTCAHSPCGTDIRKSVVTSH